MIEVNAGTYNSCICTYYTEDTLHVHRWKAKSMIPDSNGLRATKDKGSGKRKNGKNDQIPVVYVLLLQIIL